MFECLDKNRCVYRLKNHTKKSSGKFTSKNTWTYLNSSGRLVSPEPYLNTPEKYLKFTWKIQVSLPEFLPELTWKLPEKNTWTVQVIFTVQVNLPEIYLKFQAVFTSLN